MIHDHPQPMFQGTDRKRLIVQIINFFFLRTPVDLYTYQIPIVPTTKMIPMNSTR
jgi:hypothetical protein